VDAKLGNTHPMGAASRTDPFVFEENLVRVLYAP